MSEQASNDSISRETQSNCQNDELDSKAKNRPESVNKKRTLSENSKVENKVELNKEDGNDTISIEKQSNFQNDESQSKLESVSKSESILSGNYVEELENRVELNTEQQWDRLIALQFVFALILLINSTVFLTILRRDEAQIIYLNQTKWISKSDGNLLIF